MSRHFACLAFACLALIQVPVKAEFAFELTPEVVPNGTGAFNYTYLLANPSANGDDGDSDLLFDFTLAVAPGTSLSDVIIPTGWTATYLPGDEQIDWMANEIDFALAPGASLTFGFTSVLAPRAADFSVLALNQLSSGGSVELGSGVTLGPVRTAAVPEPSSLALLGLGTFGLIGFSRRRRNNMPIAP